MKNINVTGTFIEYMGSIAAEIRRLLAVKIEDGELAYSVEVQNADWSLKQDDSMPALAVVFDNKDGFNGHFSITKLEFEKNNPEQLIHLAEVRLTDTICSLENICNGYKLMIKKLKGEQK